MLTLQNDPPTLDSGAEDKEQYKAYGKREKITFYPDPRRFYNMVDPLQCTLTGMKTTKLYEEKHYL